MPFNLAYRLPLGTKANLVLSAGPYAGFFYNGKVSSETRIYSTNLFKSDEVPLDAGKETGKVNTFDAGINGRAALEIGSFYISGFMSQGLSNFYNASYAATLRHNVKGVSIGFWLNKPQRPEIKRIPVMPVVESAPAIRLPNVVAVTYLREGAPDYNIAAGVAPYEPPIAEQEVEKINFAARNLLFLPGSDQLTESSAAHLDDVAAVLAAHPAYNLAIEGHTDASGNAELNRKLSMQRAESVKRYLTIKGISSARLSAIGLGADYPVDTNETAAGRAKNRRVEMKLSR